MKKLSEIKDSRVDRINEIGNIGVSATFDTVNYDTFSFTCNMATLDLSSTVFPLGRTILLVMANGGTCNITWHPDTKWPEGEEPELSNPGVDRVVLQRVSSNSVHASLAGKSYA